MSGTTYPQSNSIIRLPLIETRKSSTHFSPCLIMLSMSRQSITKINSFNKGDTHYARGSEILKKNISYVSNLPPNWYMFLHSPILQKHVCMTFLPPHKIGIIPSPTKVVWSAPHPPPPPPTHTNTHTNVVWFYWILEKDPILCMDSWDPSTISDSGYVSD